MQAVLTFFDKCARRTAHAQSLHFPTLECTQDKSVMPFGGSSGGDSGEAGSFFQIASIRHVLRYVNMFLFLSLYVCMHVYVCLYVRVCTVVSRKRAQYQISAHPHILP